MIFSVAEMDIIINKIIQLKVLYCSKCHEFLNTPIMQLQNSQNICGRCYEKNKERDCTANTALEEILKLFSTPCRYKKNGCDRLLPYKEISVHESTCLLRNHTCVKEHCTWVGQMSKMSEHFKD